MVAIGGKTKANKPSKPQFVVQIAEHINEYAQFKANEDGELTVNWVGDPNSATKFDSKYAAKFRVRDFENVPATRCFRELEKV